MTPLGALLLLQSVQMPITPPPRPPGPASDPATLSIVIADTVDQVDPQRLCPESNCTAMYLGTFKNTRTVLGAPLPAQFSARLEMGSPYIQPYRLAFIVERRIGQPMLIRASTGFNPRTGLGCFEFRETEQLHWDPATGPNVSRRGQEICVRE